MNISKYLPRKPLFTEFLNFPIQLIVLSLFMFCGCMTQTWGVAMPNRSYHFPPASKQVELCEGVPDRAFIIVGEVQAHGDLLLEKEDVIKELMRQARKVGAEAIINVKYSKRRTELYATGNAIRWKPNEDDEGYAFIEE